MFVECWNDTASLCDRTPGTRFVAHPEFKGVTHLYVPRWMLDRYGDELGTLYGFEMDERFGAYAGSNADAPDAHGSFV